MTTRSPKAVSIALLLAGTLFSVAHGQPAGGAPPAGALGSTWADAEKMPDLFKGMWMTYSMVDSDEKLNVPYTEAAQKYVDAYKPKRDIPYAQDGCLPPGLPVAMRTGPIKFAYSPGLIYIYMQGAGHVRFIRLNEPMGPTTPKYYGNSVGHWEGDTLVVETQDFVDEISFQYGVGKGLPADTGLVSAAPGTLEGLPPPGTVSPLSKAIWGPHGPNMRMVERIRLSDPDTLEIALTIYDDAVWKQPYVSATRKFRHIVKGVSERPVFTGVPEEWVCTVSITSFDPATNQYVDKDPEEMVKFLDKLGK